jgi:regulatory protein
MQVFMAGRVTGLKVQRRNPNRINVYLDGAFAFSLQRISAAWLSIGQDLSDAEISKIRHADETEVIYQSALRLLGYRQRTAAELEKRLLQKGYDTGQVRDVVVRLLENHLLDDQRFAEAWVSDRVTFHPRSQRLMRYELYQKGLDQQVVEQAMAQAGDDEPRALAAARKSLNRWADLPAKEFVQKCAAYLARKGFSGSVCFSTARELWHELHPDE